VCFHYICRILWHVFRFNCWLNLVFELEGPQVSLRGHQGLVIFSDSCVFPLYLQDPVASEMGYETHMFLNSIVHLTYFLSLRVPKSPLAGAKTQSSSGILIGFPLYL
jgi:hypothetical protein